MAKRRNPVPEGKTQPPSTALVPAEGFEAKLGAAEAALLGGTRPRAFRAMLRAIGERHLPFVDDVLEGRATQTTHIVVSDGKDGSHVEEVTRGPTILEKLKALDMMVQGGLRGVPADVDGGDARRRGVIRLPVPVDIVSVNGSPVPKPNGKPA